MGCSNPREKLENEMMEIQITRIEIQMQKYNQLKRLSQIENRKIDYINIIPDYLDPNFARENKIDVADATNKKINITNEKKKINSKRRNSKKSKTKKN